MTGMDRSRMNLTPLPEYMPGATLGGAFGGPSMCLTCGCAVWDEPRHDEWHLLMR